MVAPIFFEEIGAGRLAKLADWAYPFTDASNSAGSQSTSRWHGNMCLQGSRSKS